MHALVVGIVIAVVILFVLGYAIVFVAQMAGIALKALGEVASASKHELDGALLFMQGWTAQKVGRANKEGEEVEIYEPMVPNALPRALDPDEERRYETELVQRTGTPAVPRIAVPKFPDIPDVLKIPEVEFSLGSASSLASHHIPTLLNGRSHECSVPTAIERPTIPSELHIPPWAPPKAFPQPPKAKPAQTIAGPRIALRLPLYVVKEDASAFRAWFVGKLNAIVRGVHHEKIQAFNAARASAQAEYESACRSNVLSSVRFEAETAIWKKVKADKEAEWRTTLTSYQDRAAQVQEAYKKRREQFEAEFLAASDRVDAFWRQIRGKQEEAVCRLFNIALARIVTPLAYPREWTLEYDGEHGILVLDLRLPDFERIQITKQVALKREVKTKPVTAKEQKQLAEVASCLYLLRAIHEVIQHDVADAVQALTVNGWVEYVDATTGRDRSIVILSLFAEREQLGSIDIGRVDPVKCISSLGGRFAGIQHGYVAIAPIVRLNRHDDRVIEGSDVLSDLATGTNLAAMGWDKFEHLIRQLFEKVFAGPGIEVKVTRASRDRGVDAIIFDPDPIRGGKTVIQAKRYINTVDLSAVRDLYGTVVNEGANKGILVTTSSFGPDAYDFSKDKNLTLVTGRELLGLLEKHGYQYRINLEEARKLQAEA
jgi:hypothetical protein